MNGNVLLFILTGVVFVAAFAYVQYSNSHENVDSETGEQ